MSPDQYCQERTRRSGSSFSISFLFLDPPERAAITALYAFCREVDDVVDECRDAGVARSKLAWWREEVGRLYAGTPQHPVTRALAPAVARYGLQQEYLLEVVDGMEMDLDQNRYPSFQDLALYCYRVAGVVGILSAEIFGFDDRHTLHYALDLGRAFQLTNILRDVGEDARRGRIYLPLDELERFGVSEQEILEGRPSARMTELLKCQAGRARTFYQAAFAALPEQDRFRQRCGLIMASIYMSALDVLEARDYPVFERRVTLPPWRKLWLAWSTARREARRHQRYRRGHGD